MIDALLNVLVAYIEKTYTRHIQEDERKELKQVLSLFFMKGRKTIPYKQKAYG